MTTQLTNSGKTIEIIYANALSSGYGHKKIEVELMHNGHRKTFSAITSNMHHYDLANDLEHAEKYAAFYELIENEIEEDVADWLANI